MKIQKKLIDAIVIADAGEELVKYFIILYRYFKLIPNMNNLKLTL